MSHANRGMALENIINVTNQQYAHKGLALITKRPVPIKILRYRGGQVQGYVESSSTVDYSGVYQGRAIEFEAKSTREAHRFDLKNIHKHQVDYFRECIRHGAVAFLIVEFVKRDERFYIPGKMMVEAWERADRGGPKSIPYEDISYGCYKLTPARGVPVDYRGLPCSSGQDSRIKRKKPPVTEAKHTFASPLYHGGAWYAIYDKSSNQLSRPFKEMAWPGTQKKHT